MNDRLLIDSVVEFLERNPSRRNFIRASMLGIAGTAFCSCVSDVFATESTPHEKSVVSFTKGKDRRENIANALKPLEADIKSAIKGKQIVIKCNLVGPDFLCATHVDAVRGLLDFLTPLTRQTIIVADSTGRVYPGPLSTFKHFEIHKYLTLPREYRVKIVDLNDMPTKVQWILDAKCHPFGINIIDTFLDRKNYLISLTPFKTHGTGIVATLGVKNIVMGSPINHYRQKKVEGRNEKVFMHSLWDNLSFNMFLIAQKVHADLSVIDGFVGMEGNGPTQGTPVEHGVALAGTDWIAVDRIGTELMGIDFKDALYLSYCAQGGLGQGNRENIDIIGPDPSSHVIRYRLHDSIRNG